MGNPTWMTPEEWLESLDRETRAAADEKIAFFTQLKARNPLGWVASEMRENIGQTARFLLLRQIRLTAVEQCSIFGLPVKDASALPTGFNKILQDASDSVHRLLAAGIDAGDLHNIARTAAYQAALSTVSIIDDGLEWKANEFPDAPEWALMERTSDGKLTGRGVEGLHESLTQIFATDD